MNQWINIEYEFKNWSIQFYLNNKEHREKPPSWNSSSIMFPNGCWDWFIQNEWQDEGLVFDWDE